MCRQNSIFAVRARDGGVDGLEVEEEGEHADLHRQWRREEQSPHRSYIAVRQGTVQKARNTPFSRSRDSARWKREACVHRHRVEELEDREVIRRREGLPVVLSSILEVQVLVEGRDKRVAFPPLSCH